MGFEQFFDYLPFKHMTALKKKIQSFIDYFLNYWFGYMQSSANCDDDCED